LAFLNGKANHAPSSVPNGAPAGNVPILETIDLWRVYRLGDLEIPALRGLNLTIGVGELIALKGRSGSGKTSAIGARTN
jgi:ABC-type multidrug transport system ATPase subunit